MTQARAQQTAVIDSHQHFWTAGAQEQPWRRPEHQVLERDFGANDLAVELDEAGIDGTILVQSVDEPAENDRLARYATDARVFGVVGWLPLQDPGTARRELDRLRFAKLVGVRCLIADDPLDWTATPDARAMFRDLSDHGLSWDVVPITRQQTEAVIKLAHSVPGLRVIIDHLGRPPIESRGWEPWSTQLSRLAACPNVAIKVSVGIDALTPWQSWRPTALRRYVDHALTLFGPDRAMLASNWPVVLLRADYQQAWADLSRLALAGHPIEPDRSSILGGTAQKWYLGRATAGAESAEASSSEQGLREACQ